ncbi:MAG: hypothetical protein H7Y02_03905 [Candidatus Obscuribacterales bacterium]|nr:hypothetical protein [Steroidobacteraceae bacterium]
MPQNATSPLLSKRGQIYLQQLHRQLADTNRAVERALSVFLAALQACDPLTQQECFTNYCDEMDAHQRVMKKIVMFLDHRLDTTMNDSDVSSSSIAQ